MKRCLRRIRSIQYPKISKIDEIQLDGTKWSTIGGVNPEPYLYYDNKNNTTLIKYLLQKHVSIFYHK